MDMQTAIVAPQPVAPIPTTPAQGPSEAQRLVDSMFNHSVGDDNSLPVNAPAPVSPAGQAQVSGQPQPPTHVPAQPGSALPQLVNPQPAVEAQSPENPLPAGVRQRIAELNERARQAEAYAAQQSAERARMEGYLLAQQQAAQQQQHQPQQAPDLVSSPEAWADHTQNRIMQEAQALIQRERQAMQQQIGSQVQSIAEVAAKTAWASDRQRAVATYGAEAVDAVEAELKANKALGDRYSFVRPGVPATDPYMRAVADHRNRQLTQAIPNGDLKAYEQQVIQRYLAGNPQALQQVAAANYAATRQAVVAPQSLANLPSNNNFNTLLADPMEDLRQMDRHRKAMMSQRSMGR